MLRGILGVWCFLLIALTARLASAQAPLLPPITPPASVTPSLPGATPAPAAAAPAAPPQNAPVTFTADEVQYDQNAALVVARGRVEAFQGGRILRADELTYNRNTGVATARGNVQLIEADGQVMFAESAELSNQMRDGVLEGLRGHLTQNGRLRL
jgi:LPS-assembly protein